LSANEGREIELKLELRPEDAARLGALKSLPHARLGLAKAEQIVTVYFDTQDHALRRAGLSLRLRHAGSRRIQTVKSEPGEGLAVDRLEDEVPVNGVGPDLARIANPALRDKVLTAASKATLAAQFETVILRTTRHVRTTKGDVVDLVVDLGEVRAETEDCPIAELELELKSGSPAALFALARTLNDTVPLRVVRLTKADRGYGLLGDEIGAPQKSSRIVLPSDATAGDAFGAILRNGLAHLLANEPAVVERRDVEGLHQLRVALRRLRAVLSTYDSLLDESCVAGFEHEIQWISAVCGTARDYDVFLASIVPAASDALAKLAGGEEALLRAANEARADAWAKVVEAVASARLTTLLIDLAGLAAREKLPLASAVKRRDLDESARAFAATALDHHRKKVAKLAAPLTQLSDEDRHRLRKRLKRLRYTAEFFSSLFPETESKPYLKRLGALQDCFGALNDFATAGRLVDSLTAFGTGKKAALLAEAGALLLAHHRKAAEALIGEAAERWARLAKRRPFWRET
jgi:inorganic triphosphatase YgiF